MTAWVFVAIAICGTILNGLRDRRGFLCWIVSNVGLIFVNVRTGAWAQAFLFAVYTVLAVWSWRKWGKA